MTPADSQRTARWFQAHQQRTPMLRQFLQRMPKGADLHTHLSGAVYAESYLQWAAAANYCVDVQKLAFVAPPCVKSSSQPLVAKLPSQTHAALVDRMSVRSQPEHPARNSLKYSFLPGPSLWQDAGRARPAAACRKDRLGADQPNPACPAHLAGSPRASRQWALEAAFDAFEKLPDWPPATGARQRR